MVRPIGGNVPNGVNPRPGVEVPLDEAARYYRAIAEGLGGNGIPDAATQRFFLNVLSQQPQLVPEGDVSAAARLRNAVRSDLGKGVSPETLAKTWQILRRLAGPQGFTAAEAKRRADALATPASGGGQALSGSKAARLPKPRLRSLAPARLALPEPLPGETVRQQVIRLKETHPWPPGPLEAAVRFAGLFRFSVLKIHREGEHPNETDPPRVMKGVADRVLGETLLTPLGALERLFFDAEIPAGNSRGFSCRIFFTTVLKIIEAAIPEEKRPEAEELARGAVRAQMDLAGVQDDIAGPEIAFMSWVMDGVVRKYWGAPIVQETDEGGNDRTVAASSTIKDALKRRALPDRSLHPNSIRPLVDGLLALGAIGNEARLAEGRVLIVPALAAYYVRVGVWQPLEKIAPPFRRALVALYRTALLRRDPGLFRIIGADHLSLDHPYRLLAREGIVPKANLPHLNRVDFFDYVSRVINKTRVEGDPEVDLEALIAQVIEEEMVVERGVWAPLSREAMSETLYHPLRVLRDLLIEKYRGMPATENGLHEGHPVIVANREGRWPSYQGNNGKYCEDQFVEKFVKMLVGGNIPEEVARTLVEEARDAVHAQPSAPEEEVAEGEGVPAGGGRTFAPDPPPPGVEEELRRPLSGDTPIAPASLPPLPGLAPAAPSDIAKPPEQIADPLKGLRARLDRMVFPSLQREVRRLAKNPPFRGPMPAETLPRTAGFSASGTWLISTGESRPAFFADLPVVFFPALELGGLLAVGVEGIEILQAVAAPAL